MKKAECDEIVSDANAVNNYTEGYPDPEISERIVSEESLQQQP